MNQALMEETDEVFLQTLYKGSEQIGQGALEEARETLERAVGMRPEDAKARNLLGLACFKLGDYAAAETLYQALVDENADDATLRVNLGLVHLKSGRFEDAIRELEVAVDLQPDHKRAQNYLGLAYARVGDYAQAEECFEAAGSPQMVEKMQRLMAGEDTADVSAAAPAAPPEGAGRVDLPEEGESDATAGTGEAGEVEGAAAMAASSSGAEAQDFGAAEGASAEGGAERPPVNGEAAGDVLVATYKASVAKKGAPATESEEVDGASGTAAGEVSDAVEGSADDAADVSGDLGEAPVADAAAPASPVDDRSRDGDSEASDWTDVEAGADQAAEAGPAAGGEAPEWPDDRDYEEQAEEPPVPTIDETKSGPPTSSRERWVLPARLLELTDALALPGQIPAPFAISSDVVVAAVDREMLTRMRGLLVMDGRLDLRPEVKRFRGRATEKPFGEGEGRVLRVSGRGRLYLATRGRYFTPVRADGADAYVCEDAVFAFEETVAYENGRVPSKVSADLNLVHLRGRGVVLLETEGPLVSTQVTPGVPLRVPLDRLVGWTGLVTPRIVAFADEGGAAGGPLTGVELAGEGRVLISLPEAG